MKAKELRKIIREAILEVLDEGTTYAGKDAVDDAQKDPKFGSLSGTGKTDAISKLKQGGAVTIGEVEIDEMARVAKGFRLADPNFDASQYADKRISGVSMADIIDFFRENPGSEKTDLQRQFNFVRPQIANAVVKGLRDTGVLVQLGRGGEEEAIPEPGEEGSEERITGPEAFFIGNTDPLAQFYSKSTGEEEDTEDEEPVIEPEKIEKVNVSTGGISDEDFESFMKYSDLRDRLNATKGNINKMKRSKGGVAGDIQGGPSTEKERLLALKKSLEDRIDTLVSGSKYLQGKIAKEQAGKAPVAPKLPEIEPVESEDEDVVAENYEYAKRQLQYRAGIRK
jgi:hypothetical protein